MGRREDIEAAKQARDEFVLAQLAAINRRQVAEEKRQQSRDKR